jgi:hypothetical protein
MQKQVLYYYNKFFASTSRTDGTGIAKQVHAIKHHLYFFHCIEKVYVVM